MNAAQMHVQEGARSNDLIDLPIALQEKAMLFLTFTTTSLTLGIPTDC